jgi:2-polyprenyl-6-hydroxyphenyl methylase/3-demethylubiquinone-9 3-methyltransferase
MRVAWKHLFFLRWIWWMARCSTALRIGVRLMRHSAARYHSGRSRGVLMTAPFAFGENWLAFASAITDQQIEEAEQALIALLGERNLEGRRFLDIGSGSGLTSLVARRLGASVHSFDYDPQSVACTAAVRDRLRPGDPHWHVEHGSVLDPDYLCRLGPFDIVYSWGVLHHTGDMARAINHAAALTNPGGLLAIALYRKTRLCSVWTMEKRWYSQASPRAQQAAAKVYVALYGLALRLRGERLADRVRTYHQGRRGMDFHRDVHDWLGGYPYESVTPATVEQTMTRLGFQHIRSNPQPMSWGVFGSGCDEFVYRRMQAVLGPVPMSST